MSTSTLTRPNVLRTANEFIAITEKQELKTVVEAFRSHLETYKSSCFQLIVAGDVKKGKSTFINTLLDAPNLLPTETQETTSVAWKVMYGTTQKYKVFFKPAIDPEDSDRIIEASDPIETTDPAVVAEYGTEDLNPGNEKNVAHIEVYHPNKILESGVVIIDTPGLSSLFDEHGEIPWQHATTANAVCFVFDSVESPATQDDIANIKRFLDITQQISQTVPACFFLQTKIDTVEESHWQDFRQRNIELIENHLGAYFGEIDINAHYFPINARRKKSDGFIPLLKFLNDALHQHQYQLAHRLLEPTRDIAQHSILPRIDATQKLLNIGRSQSKKEIQNQRAKISADFNTWKEVCSRAREDFNYNFEKLGHLTTTQLKGQLSPISDNPIIEPGIRELRAIVGDLKLWQAKIPGFSDDEIEQTLTNNQSHCIDECNRVIIKILREYEGGTNGLNGLIEECGKQIFQSIEYAEIVTPIEKLSSDKRIDIPAADLYETIRSTFGGAMTPVFAYSLGALILSPINTAVAAGTQATAIAAASTKVIELTSIAAAKAAEAAVTGTQAATAAAAQASANAAVAATQLTTAGAQTAAAGMAVGTLALVGAIVVAVAISGFLTYRHLKKSRALNTIDKLERHLLETLKMATDTATSQFGAMVIEHKKAARETFKRVEAEVEAEIKRKIKVLDEAAELDTNTYNQKSKQLKAENAQTSKYIDTLNAMFEDTSEPAPSQ